MYAYYKTEWSVQIFFSWQYNIQLDKDERSDEESEEEGVEDSKEEGGEYRWGKSTNSLNSKLSMLTNSCVLTNLNNHRATTVDRSRKTQ